MPHILDVSILGLGLTFAKLRHYVDTLFVSFMLLQSTYFSILYFISVDQFPFLGQHTFLGRQLGQSTYKCVNERLSKSLIDPLTRHNMLPMLEIFQHM